MVDSSVPHVMISYQWDAQKVMSKVKDSLVQAGYKVWMDVEHMSEWSMKTCDIDILWSMETCDTDILWSAETCDTDSLWSVETV